jgi:hypothetical protein
MNSRGLVLFLIGLVAGIVGALVALAAQPVILGYTGAYCLAPRCYCDGPVFEAAVHQGPDSGLEVEGQIKYAVNPDGSFTSQIRSKSGQLIRGNGQAVGRSLDMVLVLPDDRHIYAHGTLDGGDLRECQGGAAGPLTGPTYGDIGDWGSRYPPYIRTISGTLSINLPGIRALPDTAQR